jgi:hypothetical protein
MQFLRRARIKRPLYASFVPFRANELDGFRHQLPAALRAHYLERIIAMLSRASADIPEKRQ